MKTVGALRTGIKSSLRLLFMTKMYFVAGNSNVFPKTKTEWFCFFLFFFLFFFFVLFFLFFFFFMI